MLYRMLLVLRPSTPLQIFSPVIRSIEINMVYLILPILTYQKSIRHNPVYQIILQNPVLTQHNVAIPPLNPLPLYLLRNSPSYQYPTRKRILHNPSLTPDQPRLTHLVRRLKTNNISPFIHIKQIYHGHQPSLQSTSQTPTLPFYPHLQPKHQKDHHPYPLP